MKLLRYIIFLKTIVLLTSVSNHAFAFSSFSSFQVVQQIDTIKKDTTKKETARKPGLQTNPKDTTASEKIQYTAKDSIAFSKDSSVVYMYGKARVIYQGLELDAEFIKYDNKTNLIYARGTTDAKGKYIVRPIFKMEGQGTSLADSLVFNTVTKAGNIWGVYTEQEGGFFTGGKAKKQPKRYNCV